MSHRPENELALETMRWKQAEQAGYRRGLAESKPQSDLSFAESEYERGVQAERARVLAEVRKRLDESNADCRPMSDISFNRAAGRESTLEHLITWLEATE